MSDYLSRVAARLFGTLPTVAPRIRSVYEPSNSSATPSDLSPLDDVPTTNQTEREAAHRAGRHPRSIAPAEDMQSDWVRNPAPSERRLLNPDGMPTFDVQASAQSAVDPPRVTRSTPPLSSHGMETSSSKLERSRASLMDEANDRPAETVRRTLLPPLTDQLSTVRPLQQTSPRVVQPSDTAFSQPRSRTADARPSIAPPDPSGDLTPRRAEAEMRPDAAPTINIHIGRVEVRTTFAPPPAKSAPPVVRHTLDEYLKSRNGGKP